MRTRCLRTEKERDVVLISRSMSLLHLQVSIITLVNVKVLELVATN